MAVTLTLILHIIENLVCRALLKILRLPSAPIKPLTPEETELFKERLAALTPFVPVPEPHSLPRRIWLHIRGLFLVLLDLPAVQRRRVDENDTDFSEVVRQQLDGFPEYFHRNYHYQTDGYFTVESAYRYDMQYELVFLGLGQKIRHVAASQLMRFLPATQSYEMLECGSGTGNLGAIMQGLYPESNIVVTDPSLGYLQFAKEKYPNLAMRQEPTFMEDLSFVDSSTLDVVFSAFVFHEIPNSVTPNALAEACRTLKTGGYILALDSGQDHDGPENASFLDQFEGTFYEPYYGEYRQSSLEEWMEEAGFEVVHHQMLLFSKVVVAKKR